MPGYGKHQWRKATAQEKLTEETFRIRKLAGENSKILMAQIDALVEQLFVKYLDNPDNETKRLLTIHLGSEFFERVEKSAQQAFAAEAEVAPQSAQGQITGENQNRPG